MVIWSSKLHLASSSSIVELLLVALLDLFVASNWHFAIILVVQLSSLNITSVKTIRVRGIFVGWMWVDSISSFFVGVQSLWRAHKCILYSCKGVWRLLSYFAVSVEDSVAFECWRHISLILSAINSGDLSNVFNFDRYVINENKWVEMEHVITESISEREVIDFVIMSLWSVF